MMERRRIPCARKRPSWSTAVRNIRTVRRTRGRNATGDSLLQSAIAAVSSNDSASASQLLEQFVQCPDLTNEHRLLITIACRKLKPFWLKAWQVISKVFDPLCRLLVSICGGLGSSGPQNSFCADNIMREIPTWNYAA